MQRNAEKELSLTPPKKMQRQQHNYDDMIHEIYDFFNAGFPLPIRSSRLSRFLKTQSEKTDIILTPEYINSMKL